MIEVTNLTKSFNSDFSALLNISFKTDSRPMVIIGEDGAGKTTLLNILAGLDKDYEGEVKVNNVDRKSLSLAELKLSYITEEPTLFNGKTVYQNLEYVFKVENKRFDKLKAREEIKKVSEDLEIFGILDRKVKSCSSFEKRLICLARAVLKKSKIILVDEPFKNLIKYEIASLWQTLLSVQGKLSSDLVVAGMVENTAYFVGCNVLKIEHGVKKD